MNTTKNSKLTGNAKTLRKNMTKEERHLWYDFLKILHITVNGQKVIVTTLLTSILPQQNLLLNLIAHNIMKKKVLRMMQKEMLS